MVRRIVRGVSQLLLTAGLVGVLFLVHQVYVSDWLSDRQQERIADDLREEWVAPSVPGEDRPPPAFGDAFAFLHVPAFGPGWVPRAVVEGVDPAQLADGPGHYPGSALPGEVGNFSLAGHRVGQGSPFGALDQLDAGDALVVETADTWFTYRVTERLVVDPTDVSVVAAVPGEPTAYADDAYITLTTCHPKFSNRERLVVHGVLEAAVAKADEPGGPAVLASGS
jgi:sortase A